MNGVLEPFPLKKTNDRYHVWYVSAIALRLTQFLNIPAIEIAQKIQTELNSQIQDWDVEINQLSLDGLWKNIVIQVSSPGWIYFRFTPNALALWLQSLLNFLNNPRDYGSLQLNTENNTQIIRNSTNLFTIQYTHARCSALLYLAEREGLLQLRPLDPIRFRDDAGSNDFTHDDEILSETTTHSPHSYPSPNSERAGNFTIGDPNPISWLDNNQHFHLSHPAEQALLNQIITTVDWLNDPTIALTTTPLKLAQQLSNQFQHFYASCPIWGAAKSQSPALAQTRLGLVMITRILLRSLLQDYLGAIAPNEL